MSPVDRDPYDVLGVARSASADEIKAAYRKLAREVHPDVNTHPDAEKQFAQVQQAWEVLGDPEKRSMYDRYGSVGPQGGAGGGWGGGGVQMDPGQFSEIFEEMFSGGGSPFGGGGFGQTGRPAPRRGVDQRQDLHVTFVTAVTGGVEAIKLDDGSTVQLKIPAGIEDGGTLRLRGKGPVGMSGGEAGDLLVTVHVGAHPLFTRQGLNLLVHVPVTIAEAVHGVQVDLQLISGSVTVRIPAGTSSGTRLRIAGQGVASASGKTGDVLVTVDIVAPKQVSDELAAALQAEDLGDPRANVDGIETVRT